MNQKEGSNEYAQWQAHARQLQADAIGDQLLTGLDVEAYIGIPVSDATAATFTKGFVGEGISLDEIIGEVGNKPSEVLRFVTAVAKRNSLGFNASSLMHNCSELKGWGEWDMSSRMNTFLEETARLLGGHKNEPIYDAVQKGWEAGRSEFLEAIEGPIPLLDYSKKLLDVLPGKIEHSILGEKMMYLDTKIPNVQVKYWYGKVNDKPNMAVRVLPF